MERLTEKILLKITSIRNALKSVAGLGQVANVITVRLRQVFVRS